MTFVGDGRGEWITETSYKYVGVGAGDLTVVSGRRNYMPFFCCALVALAVVLAIVLWPSASATTRQKFPLAAASAFGSIRKCTFWGDPHVLTFDGARPSVYGDGEFWIIKSQSPSVKIQGRYMGTPYTYGLAATSKVAVGGEFIGNHLIEIEPMEHAYGGHILVDGKVVLTDFGNLEIGGAKITYDDQGEIPDKAASKWQRRIVHLTLPRGISMTIFRWGNYVDLTIEMPRLSEGQDGTCGNFNGVEADDSTEEVFKRLGARVTDNDLLFDRHAKISFTTEEARMMRSKCDAAKLTDHERTCREELSIDADTATIDSCVFDLCFAANEHALQTAKTFATAVDKAAAHSANPM